MVWTQAESQQVWPWLVPFFPVAGQGRTTQTYGQNGEIGVDLALPLHTPITSLTLGTVISTGWFGGGGVVCVASQLDGIGIASVYYQHLDDISVQQNQIVHVGDLIGLSGGQLSGGYHPVTCCSTGPHIEVGINPPGGANSIWKPLGQNMDPRPWLVHLQAYGPPARDLAGGVPPVYGLSYLPPTGLAHVVALSDVLTAGTGPVADTFLGIEQRIDLSMQFIPIDWTTISSGTHWWDYVLPWQYGFVEQQAASNIAGAVSHNIAAVLLRGMLIIIGVCLILAFVAGLALAAYQESGLEDASKAAAKAGAEAAPLIVAAG